MVKGIIPFIFFLNNESRPNHSNRKQFKIFLTDVNVKGLLQLKCIFEKIVIALCNKSVNSNLIFANITPYFLKFNAMWFIYIFKF